MCGFFIWNVDLYLILLIAVGVNSVWFFQFPLVWLMDCVGYRLYCLLWWERGRVVHYLWVWPQFLKVTASKDEFGWWMIILKENAEKSRKFPTKRNHPYFMINFISKFCLIFQKKACNILKTKIILIKIEIVENCEKKNSPHPPLMQINSFY